MFSDLCLIVLIVVSECVCLIVCVFRSSLAVYKHTQIIFPSHIAVIVSILCICFCSVKQLGFEMVKSFILNGIAMHGNGSVGAVINGIHSLAEVIFGVRHAVVRRRSPGNGAPKAESEHNSDYVKLFCGAGFAGCLATANRCRFRRIIRVLANRVFCGMIYIGLRRHIEKSRGNFANREKDGVGEKFSGI